MSANPLDSLQPLAALTRVFALAISNVGHSDLTPLAGLASVQRFTATDNAIEDISVIEGWDAISTLVLNHNAIDDIQPLLSAKWSAEHPAVQLNDNPIDCDASAAVVAELEGRGVSVELGCQ